eukprot:scaffold165209_cov46-Attheya_sp.AAC.5
MSETSKYEKKRKHVTTQSDDKLVGEHHPPFSTCAPSRFLHGNWYSISQSAYLLVHKSSSQLYHSVLTTYYSTDTDCRKQYLLSIVI